jgi:FAD-dependent oxidoreductase domain-containing protein 1
MGSGTSGSGIMKADAVGRIAAAGLIGYEEAVLADGTRFKVSRLSLRNRDVEMEELII